MLKRIEAAVSVLRCFSLPAGHSGTRRHLGLRHPALAYPESLYSGCWFKLHDAALARLCAALLCSKSANRPIWHRMHDSHYFTVIDVQGLDIEPEIIIVTRLIPNARGTSCDQRIEPINNTKHCYILRVPFRKAE